MSQVKKRRHRRKLYAGGAMMVLAPLGMAGCDVEKAVPLDQVPPGQDLVGEVPDGYVPPDAIAIAPFDPGPLDVDVREFIAIAPIDDGFPHEIAIVGEPFGQPDVGEPEAMVIAPFDPGPSDPGPADTTEIALADVTQPETVGPGTPCEKEGTWCSEDLMCQAQAICIVPTECCGGCACEPVPCNPAEPACPPGSECLAEGDKGHCVQQSVPKPGGFMAPCETDEDCLQEYFCQQTIFCIAPAPGDGRAPPDFCNQKNCVPVPCALPDKQCPTGSKCFGYGMDGSLPPLTCVRNVGEVPGGFLGTCSNSKDCLSNQYFCQSLPVMCIVPCDVCLPLACDEDEDCPPGSECQDVGITTVCVKKT